MKNRLSAQYIVAKYHPEIVKNASSRTMQLGVGLALGQTKKPKRGIF